MEEQQQSQQPQIPVTPQPSTPVSEATPSVTKKIPVTWEKIIPLVLACLAILTGIGVFMAIQGINNRTFEPKPITIVVTPTPSPTPIRNITNLSTSSAYTAFTDAVASLSSNIQEFEKEDPSLSPPTLVLPLGF